MRTLAAILLALVPALSSGASPDDPPTRVGRVAWTQGEVLLYADPDRGWEKAYVNSPLTSENSVWTEPGARAEVRIGSTTLRAEETTQLDIQWLDDMRLQAHVVRGSLAVTLRHFEPGERYALSTPQGRFQLRAPGRYRIDADADQQLARLTVFAGSAEIEAASGRVAVAAGQAVRVAGTFAFEPAVTTAFDEWAVARDERFVDRQASRYVSPRMTGYEDLDPYGEWAEEPAYGPVWYPVRVAVDWAPYRDGRWSYVRPWGWTWIDNAPWGYAPFHYGRWVYHRGRWGWTPGRYVPRPVWAPALVAWVGGAGWSVNISSGTAPAIGWYPLAPWDRFQPWYTRNNTYINNVNVVVVNRPPRDRDRDHERDRDHNRNRGATVVLRENFVAQRPVASAMVPMAGEVVRGQPVVQGSAVLPGRAEVARTKPLRFETAPQAKPAMPGQPVQGAAAPGAAPPMAVSKPKPAMPGQPVQGAAAPGAAPPMAVSKPAAPAQPAARAPVQGQAAGPSPVPQAKPVRVAPASPPAPTPMPSVAAPVPKPKPAREAQPAPAVRMQPSAPSATGQAAGGQAHAPAPQAKPVAKPLAKPEKIEAEPKPVQGERAK